VRATLIAAGAVLVMAGCGAPAYPGTQPLGTVSGQVLGWPCAPVETPGSLCAGRPIKGAQVQFTPAGSGVGGTAVTDAGGAYSINLLPGTYKVAVKNVRTMKGPAQVNVTAGQVTTANFTFDTGIR
jgi:hypothetical protein